MLEIMVVIGNSLNNSFDPEPDIIWQDADSSIEQEEGVMGELEALSGAGGAGIVPGNYLKPKLNGFLSQPSGCDYF